MSANYKPSDASLGTPGEPPFGGVGDEAKRLEAGLNITRVVYVLHAIAPAAMGVTFFVAVFINYSRLSLVAGTYLESHFRFQIRTFWFSMLYTLLGISILVYGFVASLSASRDGGWGYVWLGLVVLLFALFWHIYRVVRGFMRLAERQPMYTD